jgi:uncharacterized protein YbaR (Trm112 family)
MALDQELLDILRCPETRQPVALADAALVAKLNALISEGQLTDRGGETVKEPVDAALVREDGTIAYLVRDEIPEMLIDSGIELGRL